MGPEEREDSPGQQRAEPVQADRVEGDQVAGDKVEQGGADADKRAGVVPERK